MSDPNLLALLQKLVAIVTKPYQALPETRAILSIGSVSYEIVDEYSDVDIALYYEELPSEEALARCMNQNGVDKLNWCLGDRGEGYMIESYYVHGVECQFAHTTLAAMEREMNSVLVDLDTTTPFQKALSGVLAGQTICGDALIQQYKARAADYPEALRVAMVQKFFTFQPWWALEARLAVRDTKLWRASAMVEDAQNLLGALAGLNRLYYSTFQFKRMAAFVEHMDIKPNNLIERLNTVIDGGPDAPLILRQLVEETADLIEVNLPNANIEGARKALARTEHRWSAKTLAEGLATLPT